MIKAALRVMTIACFQAASIGFAYGIFKFARHSPEPWQTTTMFVSFGIIFGNAWLTSLMFYWGPPKPATRPTIQPKAKRSMP